MSKNSKKQLKAHWPTNEERLKRWRLLHSVNQLLGTKPPPVRIYKT